MLNSNAIYVDNRESNEDFMDASTMSNDESDNEESVMDITTTIPDATPVASSSTSTSG